ncbi:MAG: hypothetical protein MUF42_01510 [Cytophagaceae bacterium]|jgi:uncharacterized protein (TIGR02145 family)|nr:hypothetical protein [Cytophagaceae bacterium]
MMSIQKTTLVLLCIWGIGIFSCNKKSPESQDPLPSALPSHTFRDERDQRIYPYVAIGKQVWMATDLSYRPSSGSYCFDNNPLNCDSVSVLYDYETAITACPAGWHLPHDSEWQTLEKFIGFSDADTAIAGGTRGDASSLKSGGSAGFNMSVYSGYYTGTNYFSKGKAQYYWSKASRCRKFDKNSNGIFRFTSFSLPETKRMCVRCIQN